MVPSSNINMRNQVCLLFFALVFFGTGEVVSECDTNALIDVSYCVSTVFSVNVTPDRTSTSTNGTAAVIRPYCNEKYRRKTFLFTTVHSDKFVMKIKNCVQPFIDGCENLNQHVDLDRMVQAWANVCDDLDGFIEQFACIGNRFGVMLECVGEYVKNQSAEGIPAANASNNPEELARKRAIATQVCTTRFPDTCGNFDNIINSVVKVIFPPLCDKPNSSTMGEVVSECDTNGLVNVTLCSSTLFSVKMARVRTSTSNDSIAAVIRPYCNETFVTKLKNCVQPFADGCESLNLHLDRTTKAWANVCDDLDEIFAQGRCVVNRFGQIGLCVGLRMLNQSTSLLFSGMPQNASTNPEELASKLTTATQDCQTRFPDTCGNFNKIINSVFKVIFPPLCDKPNTSTGRTTIKPKSSTSRMVILPSVLSVCVLMSLGWMIFDRIY